MRKFSQKVLSVATAMSMVFGMLLQVMPAQAAGVAVTVTPDSITSAVSTAVSFTSATGLAVADTVTVSYDAGYTASAVAITGTGLTASSTCTTAHPAVCTIGGTDALAAAGVVTVTFTLSAIPAQNSYAFAIVTSTDEFGAAMQYVGHDNDVTVTANVMPSLSFNIRTLADDADLNLCDLGTVNTSTLPNNDLTDNGAGECGYALAVGTNAQGGFQVQVVADDFLNNTTADLADIANDAAWAAGTEAYGLATVVAADKGRDPLSGLYDVTITEDGDFATTVNDSTPVPQAAANFVSYTDGIEYVADSGALDTTRVMHGLTVGSGTPAGYYDQVVTYTVTANF